MTMTPTDPTSSLVGWINPFTVNLLGLDTSTYLAVGLEICLCLLAVGTVVGLATSVLNRTGGQAIFTTAAIAGVSCILMWPLELALGMLFVGVLSGVVVVTLACAAFSAVVRLLLGGKPGAAPTVKD
jgi:hypothetical protein